jgi:hypothetical protein
MITSARTRNVIAAALFVAASVATADTPADRMAAGKTAADLGQYDTATQAFTALADDTGAPADLRAEALVRLGSALRAAGHHDAAVKAFERAAQTPDLPLETKGLLVLTLGGALPGSDRWATAAPHVTFAADRTDPKRPTMKVLWWDTAVPDRARIYKGKPITLHVKEAGLNDIFRMIADVSGLNVVVFPGVEGKVTLDADNEPWDRVLHRILAANGLAYLWKGAVMTIGNPKYIGSDHAYAGRPVAMDFKDADLRGVLAVLAASGDATVALDASVSGRVTIVLRDVPWDQAFDVVALTNGLDWSSTGSAVTVTSRGAGPAAGTNPFVASPLRELTLDGARLRGIVRDTNSTYRAVLEGPSPGPVYWGAPGSRLQDASMILVDQDTVTFQADANGRRSTLSLYPKP